MIDDLLFRTLDLKNQVQILTMIIARMLLGEQIPILPSTILWKPWKPYITLFFNHEHQQSLTVWPLQWLACNFTPLYHPWIINYGHKNKGNEYQLKKLLIVEQILLVSTLSNFKRTVLRIWVKRANKIDMYCRLECTRLAFHLGIAAKA